MFCKILILFLLLGVYAKKLPNFIILLADDLGYNDLGSYGSPTIQTPHLDQMALEGLRFTQFYSAASLCSPSRASLFTGRLPVRTGVYTRFSYPYDNGFRVFYPSSIGCLLKSEITLANYLKSKDYDTFMVGKNHLGHNKGCLPTDRGFDHFYGLPFSHEEGWPTFPESLGWPPIPLYNDTKISEQPVNLTTLTSRYNERILSFLDQQAKSQRSFFLHVAYEQPHIPLFSSPTFTNISLRGPYGDAVQEMDDSIGKILNKLKLLGLDKNTLVFFASDNGAWVHPSSGLPNAPSQSFNGGCNGALTGEKGSTMEGGMRVVALFWWPNHISSGVSMQVASMLDLVPTILDFATISVPPNITLDGFSLVPLLTQKNQTSPYLFFYYWRDHSLYAIRYLSFKCHFITRNGFGSDPPQIHQPCLLFNLEWDPSEQFPLNVTDYPNIYDTIRIEYQNQISTMVFGPSQLELQTWSVVPCCQNDSLNLSSVLKSLKKYGYGLEMWQNLQCTC